MPRRLDHDVIAGNTTFTKPTGDAVHRWRGAGARTPRADATPTQNGRPAGSG